MQRLVAVAVHDHAGSFAEAVLDVGVAHVTLGGELGHIGLQSLGEVLLPGSLLEQQLTLVVKEVDAVLVGFGHDAVHGPRCVARSLGRL